MTSSCLLSIRNEERPFSSWRKPITVHMADQALPQVRQACVPTNDHLGHFCVALSVEGQNDRLCWVNVCTYRLLFIRFENPVFETDRTMITQINVIKGQR